MYIIIGILVGLILAQFFILWKFQRQVKDICRQLAFLIKNDSNMLISREFDFGGIGWLADILNEFLKVRKKERVEYLGKEKMIADTYTNLSHDIRTPLTSLDGYFQLLEASSDEETRKRYLKIIQERIQSLKEMLEELFTFTKLKNDSYQLELTKCCMNRILKEIVFSYYDEWMRIGITPNISITEELLYLNGNVQGLRRVIQNIIKNGLDHGKSKIKIVLTRAADHMVLKISNQVLHPEEIDASQVFERFYKADAARNRTSTGLGLSIARELVLRMGGEIRADIIKDEFEVKICFPIWSK
ncbi:MAG: HAMP domain-containing histidine kinase [Lachnospiraceae bacterium]|jgi:signal transduction histidine kinase|nr:HAMP domain-containing histidine kinase [Lachnospiraceae bacterium]